MFKSATAQSLTGFVTSWDILSLLIFVGLAIGAGYFFGKNRINLILISGYFSFLILKIVPWERLSFIGITKQPDSTVSIFIFFAIIVLLFLALPQSFFGLRSSKKGKVKFWQLWIHSILVSGFLVSVVFSFMPVKVINDFSPLAKQIFVGQDKQFLWLILPLIGATIFRHRKYTVSD